MRSLGGAFKPDPGVVPSENDRESIGLQVVMTGAQHTDLNDRGADELKDRLAGMLSQFLDDERPLPKRPIITVQYAPGTPY